MELEIEELRRQRDLAQSQVEELSRKLQEEPKVFSLSNTCLFLKVAISIHLTYESVDFGIVLYFIAIMAKKQTN